MATETFRVHLHESGVQHTLTVPDHEALRITAVPDEEWDNGFVIEGSNDGLSWQEVVSIEAATYNQVVASPWLQLRVIGGGTTFGDPRNATVTVEYLAGESATAALDDGSITITNTPLEVEGQVETILSDEEKVYSQAWKAVLDDILQELRKQTILLEEISR